MNNMIHTNDTEEKKIMMQSPLDRSASMKHRVLEHNIEIDTARQKNKWTMCCSERKTDARLLTFVASFIVTMTLLIFSCYQLTHVDDCQSENLYTGLITLVIGVWIKSPLSN